MIKKNKKQLILSSVILLLPIAVGLIIWCYLPETLSIHWTAVGQADGWSSRAIAVFGMPVIFLIVQWLLVLLTAADQKNREQNNKVMSMVLWIIPILSVLVCSYIYAFALGAEINADIIFRLPMGLIFLILGNYMPKCKQNHTIGVRVTWTLQSEDNWNRTHRFAGRVWVIGGVILLATMMIPMKVLQYSYLAVILALAFIPILYSYIYYRKQVKRGIIEKGNSAIVQSDSKKRNTFFAFVGIGILIFVAVFLLNGDYHIEYGDTAFTIQAAYWEDATVDYEDIDTIEYREQDNSGSRTFGYGDWTLKMGEFENVEFGHYTRYSYNQCDSCVVLTIGEETLVVNGRSEQDTKEIYNELMERAK